MPLLLIIKLVIDGACGVLNSLGGFHWLFCRRFIMPFVLAVGVSIGTHNILIGLTVLPVIGTLCLGYFGGGWLGRGSWLCLQSLVIGIGSLLTGHLYWFFFVPYILLSGILGATLYELQQIISDIIFGICLGIIVFLVH